MKKWSVLLLAVIFTMVLAACTVSGGNAAGNQSPATGKSVEEVISIITEDAGIEMQTMITPLDEENFSWFMFVDPVQGAQAVAADAMMSSVAHSVVLARMPDGTDMEALKQQVMDKADPRKWICVGAEKTMVEVHGDLILLVMSTEEVAEAVVDHFMNLE